MSRLLDEQAKIKAGGEIAGGKYRLVRSIGEGGMGFVWEALQTGIGDFEKPVALKLVLERENPEESRRLFLNEAKLSARLQHPNLIQIYDVGQDGALDYIAMELIDGIDLDDLLLLRKNQGHTGIPWKLAAAIVIEACKGLSYAHRKEDRDGSLLHLIHRDLKPGNILISKDGFVKIIDFGIAKSKINSGKTKTGMVKGTPAYMPPEQLNAEVLDERADIYAMGAILYELCCGRAAFEGDTLFTILFAVQTKQPTPPSQLIKDFPERIETIILRCMTKDRKARYATAKDLQRALESAMAEHKYRLDHEDIGNFIKEIISGTTHQDFLPTNEQSAFKTTDNQLTDAVKDAHTFDLVAGSYDKQLESSDKNKHARDLPSGSAAFASHKEPAKANRIKQSAIGLIILLLCLTTGVVLSRLVSKPNIAKQHAKTHPARTRAPQKKHHATINQKRPVPPPRKRLSVVPKKRTNPTIKSLARPKPTKRRRRRVRRVAKRIVRRLIQKRKALLFVDIQPRCQILKGSAHIGISNGAALKLPAGQHTLLCINYNKKLAYRFQVSLKAGQPTRVKRHFRRGKLFVISFPFATLSLKAHGVSFGHIGRSHDHIPLYAGKYTLTMHKLGNVGITRTINITISPAQLTRPKVIW